MSRPTTSRPAVPGPVPSPRRRGAHRAARLATATTTGALAVAAAGLLLSGPAAQAASGPSGTSSPRAQVRLDDDCDRASFEAVLGAGACVGDGGTTFPEFVEELQDKGFHGAWRNRPTELRLAHGEPLRVTNVGGEFHSFTEVARFGGGCLPEINALIGATPVPECADPAVFSTVLPAGATATVPQHLHPGTHRFECILHPWMRTTVTVTG